jgi:hypothetical protein
VGIHAVEVDSLDGAARDFFWRSGFARCSMTLGTSSCRCTRFAS